MISITCLHEICYNVETINKNAFLLYFIFVFGIDTNYIDMNSEVLT